MHFAFYVKDEHDQIKGGCSGYLFYGSLYVDLLWVDESLRSQQFGTKLMGEVEKLAKDNNCRFIAVNTLDFEAPDFYKELGFLNMVTALKQSGFKRLMTLGKTLYQWREEVVRMWRFTKNNGITEGFHRKMKLIQRRAYEFRNFENYRLRVRVLCS